MAGLHATPKMISYLFVLIYLVLPSLCQVPPGSPVITGPEVIVKDQLIVLTCKSTGGMPTPTVKWFRDNTEITTGISSTTSGNVVTTTYTFTATLNEHYEVFECQAENGVLQNPLKITKFVYVHYTPDAPVLTGPDTITAGNPGQWTCVSANGYPAGVMSIRNQDTGVTFPASQFNVTNTPVNAGRSWTVTGVLDWSPQLVNNGNSLCCDVQHTSTLGNTPQTVCKLLTVKAALAINAPTLSYTPIIGTSVTLVCQITAGTATGITWSKDGQQLTLSNNARYSNGNVNQPSLTISQVQQSDGGNYVCTATDGTTTVNANTINVNPQGTPPAVTIPVPSYTQIVGQSITLVCQVQSPNSALQSVQWSFTSQPNNVVTDPLNTGTGKYTGSTVSNPSLTINNVQFSDRGTYRCRATNLIGTTNSATSTSLDVTGTIPVVQIPTNSYTETYGNQLTITCNIVSANPSATNVFWRRTNGVNTVTINSGDSGYQGSTPGTPSLTINFLRSTDTGTYTCHATNVVGTGNSNPATVTVNGGLLSVSQSPAIANVLQGNSQLITCQVTGTPTATNIVWYFTPSGGTQRTLSIQNNAKYSGGIVSNPSLTISGFQTTDAGTYVCEAVNVAGTRRSATNTVLTFIQRLTVTISPSQGTAIVGDASHMISCSITGTPSATSVSWTRRPINGGSSNFITAGAKYVISNSLSNPTLTISNIAESDEQDYFCQATNIAGTTTSSASRLTVNGGLNSIAISPANANVIQGNNQLITCTVTGLPSPTMINWYFTPNGSNRRSLNIASSNGKYQGGTVNSPSMTVTNFQSTDAGSYVCEAVNAAGTATSTSSNLNFLGILSVTVQPSTQTATIGDNSVTINCQISGSPQATSWEWTKTVGSNTQIIAQGTNTGKLQVVNSPTNPNLRITSLVSSDSGVYRCRANNGAGQITSGPSSLTVQGTLPTINVEPSQYTATVGDATFQFQCTVTATPQATSWYWTFTPASGGGAQTISQGTNNGQYTVDNSASKPHLTIKNIALNEAGDYVCHASNAVGSASSTASKLLVTGGILGVNISPSATNVVRGNSQVIQCLVSGTPTATAIGWFFTPTGGSSTQLQIASSNGKYSGGTVGNPHITITNFQSSDSGSYRCTATNAAGIGTSPMAVLTYVENLNLVVSPAQGNAVLGTAQYVIQCQITGQPSATSWSWVKNSGTTGAVNIPQSTNNAKYTVGSSSQNPSLTIKNIQQSDDASYTCQATNTAGTRTSSSARLIVTGQLPSISVTPLQQFPQFGASSVTIQCIVSASPSADTVGWRKNSINGATTENIDAPNSNGKYSVVNSKTNPDLTISNVNFNDDANYQCFAQNAVGTGFSANARIDVIGSLPQVTIPQSAYNVVFGNNAEIPCTITGANPAVTAVTWYRVSGSNQQTSINVGDVSQYSGGTVANPTLTVLNVNTADAGLYKCTATNQVGTGQSSNTQLNIVGGLLTVNVPSPTYSVLLGSTTNMVCTVSGTPSATDVYWEKRQNDGSFQRVDMAGNNRYSGGNLQSPTLIITSSVFSDEGNYRCVGVNAAGTANSIVTNLDVTGSAPVVNIASNAYSVNVGNPVTLQCSVSANPLHTSVKWQRVDGNNNAADVDMTNGRYSGSSVNSPSLVISQTIKGDEGRYICMATNAVGTGQSSQTYLTVVGSIPTVTVPQPQYSANKGSTITLECSYTANPMATMVRWERTQGGTTTDLADPASTTKYGGSTVASASLIIYDAQESDEGTYKCKVTNGVGTGISTATTLDVVGNIPLVTVPQGAYTVNVGQSIVLQCQVTADPTHTSVYWRKVTAGSITNIDTALAKYDGSSVGTPSLTINNAVFADSGTYYCYATNSVGTGQSTQVVVAVAGTTPSVSLTQTSITANYGEDVTIGCVVSANPAATSVYWQKITGNNNPVTIDTTNSNKYSGGSVNSPSLQIKNADVNDIAKYVCYAANSVGTGQSAQGTLNVVGSPPTVTIPQATYTINIGNTITIACTVVSNPRHTSVYWTRTLANNQVQQISTTGASSTKYGGATVDAPSLVIYNVQMSDGGQYNCHATNVVGTGKANSPTQLNVVGNVPTVTATIPGSARIDTSVTINCNIDANPSATQVIWQFITNNAASNIDITNNNRYSGGTVNTPHLTINPVRASDEGSYKCQAVNAQGTGTSNQVYLDATGDPPVGVTVTPNPITVQEGQAITATCSAQGTPTPTYEWRKFGTNNVISTGAVLTISNAQESHKGAYVCRAFNSFGANEASVNVDVQFTPKVRLTNVPANGSLGKSATINCEFTSNPFATNVKWKRTVGGVETALNVDGNKYQGGTLSSPSLTIFNLNANDQAEYICEVTNSVGSGRSNMGRLTVDMRTSPMGIQIFPGQITVLEGNSFSIYCNATANPSPSYEWFHDDTKVGTGQTYTVQNSVWGPHDGLYTCKAFNVIGDQQATIDVDVKYIPVSAVTENTFTPPINTALTLTCNTKANPSAISWKWFQNGYEIPDQKDKSLYLDMDKASDAGDYHCIAYNEVGHSPQIRFTVTVGGSATTLQPDTGAAVASAGGLTGGEIAAICLGILFFLLLLILLIVCCVMQGCCVWCCGAAGEKDRRITPDQKMDIPRFYEVPTVVTREPSLISKRDVSLHMAPVYRPQNDYEITKYRVVRPEYDIDERYVTSAASTRPLYLPPIEYTYDEEERRRRRRKKKRSRRHDEMRGDEQIVLEERVVGGGDVYRTTRSGEVEEVAVGPEFYFEAE